MWVKNDMKGYVFLSNSNKPTEQEQHDKSEVKLTNVSRPCLQVALDMGYDVYFGINRDNSEGLPCELPVHMYDSHTYRSITAIEDNKIAYRNLLEVINKGKVEVIHCNTPVGGLVGRLAGKKCKVKKIIYTAHGFHFYKGAPFINRTVFKWAEMIMAHWTDAIITMNQEDYEAAKKFHLRKGGKVFYIPGVGINTTDFLSVKIDRNAKRSELGLNSDDIVCISMGDLILRKDYATAISAVAKCNDNRIHYFICGEGPELDSLKKLSTELGVENQIHFLGFRTDIKELAKVSDIFLFTTLQEGMPRSMMEAMASGLPCIASKIRGNVDLLEDGIGGYLCEPKDVETFAKYIGVLTDDAELRQKQAQANLERIKEFDVKIIKEKIKEIYQEVLSR